MATQNQPFQTIRTEGAILPPDVLCRIASLKVDGATPDAYHLPPGSKANEAISQSWTSMLTYWQAFKEGRATLSATDGTGTAVTNERWLLPFFKELDYGRLTTTKSPEIDGRVYPIERFYNHTPIHLIGCKLLLDRRTRGARGAATASPHSMVQEYLNRSDQHLWAFLSNGLQLRILRDNVSLSRQAFVEFDLEAMMDGEVYADFALLWLLCHQSRIESEQPEDCWLEKWSQLAREEGTRVLQNLRGGVAKAIEALGRGFIGHPRNDRLRDKLRTGVLTKDDYYRQLLRVVYRLLFLFVAEDRKMLHPSDTSEDARNLYDTHYSTRRLRDLADKMRGSKHADLWHSLSLVFNALGKNEGCPQLALCGLGSFLWQASSTPDLLGPHRVAEDRDTDPVLITNYDFMQAIRDLAYVEQDRVRRMVDYRNLGSEELGSVYEALLELHPVMNAEAKAFELLTAAGDERKITGSYYTPDSLVQCLLDSALDPVIHDRLKGKKGHDAEHAILDMKVCDPACGSGHFLIAAAQRLARHLARIRTGEMEPNPEDYQHALRDIIGRCLYGVDLNPMAVELCKVSLWLEAIEPGKPLSFLDHHIRVGNSLIGATPKLIAEGLPDDALKAIEGDDKKACTLLKRRNRSEREGLGPLFAAEDKEAQEKLTNSATQLGEMADDRPEDIRAKEIAFKKHEETDEYRHKKQLADIWCAAFVFKKYFSEPGRDSSVVGITQDHLTDFTQGQSLPQELIDGVDQLAVQYQFFHWHLNFPEVFAEGGFDCVLANPPWERVKIQEKEWFAERSPDIASAPNAAARKQLIKKLIDEAPKLYEHFLEDLRKAEGESHFLRHSGLFPLCGRGDINLYTVFAEEMRWILNPYGRVGCVLPSGIATDDTTKYFFQDVIEKKSLVSFFDFENKSIFEAVHSSTKFCLFTAGNGAYPTSETAKFVFFAHSTEELKNPERRIILSNEDISLLNPNTKTCPIFRSRKDAELTKAIYRRVPVLIGEERDSRPEKNSWGIKFKRMFDMSNDSGLFRTREQLEFDGWQLNGKIFKKDDKEYLPLYEAKMIHHYNHRFGDYADLPEGSNSTQLPNVSESKLQDPNYSVLPRYWVPKEEVNERLSKYEIDPEAKERKLVWEWPHNWLMGWRDITNVTNERTTLSSIWPKSGAGDTFLQMLPQAEGVNYGILIACLNSFIQDYSARQKVGGTHLKYHYFKQLPIISPNMFSQTCLWFSDETHFSEWFIFRVLELSYSACDLESFAQYCGFNGAPFRWDENRRFLLRCELDAAFFHLYLPVDKNGNWNRIERETHDELESLKASFPSPRDAVDYILETFPIVKKKDIEKFGDYRTKLVILKIYDKMQEAMETGNPYQTLLDPPSADPRCCHPARDGTLAPGSCRQLSDLMSDQLPKEPFPFQPSSELREALGTRSCQCRVLQPTDPLPEQNAWVIIRHPALLKAGTPCSIALGRFRYQEQIDARTDEGFMYVLLRGEQPPAELNIPLAEWAEFRPFAVLLQE